MARECNMRFSRDHVWVERTDAGHRAGLTDYAQQELGEIAFVELPEVGIHVREGDTLCSIDSLKSSSDLYAPYAGTVKAVNTELEQEGRAKVINEDPTGEGWIVVLEPEDRDSYDSLMDVDAYRRYIGE